MMAKILELMYASPRAAYIRRYVRFALACRSAYFARSSAPSSTFTVSSCFGGSSRILRPPMIWFLAWRTVNEPSIVRARVVERLSGE